MLQNVFGHFSNKFYTEEVDSNMEGYGLLIDRHVNYFYYMVTVHHLEVGVSRESKICS
jgi:hypothetical protein